MCWQQQQCHHGTVCIQWHVDEDTVVTTCAGEATRVSRHLGSTIGLWLLDLDSRHTSASFRPDFRRLGRAAAARHSASARPPATGHMGSAIEVARARDHLAAHRADERFARRASRRLDPNQPFLRQWRHAAESRRLSDVWLSVAPAMPLSSFDGLAIALCHPIASTADRHHERVRSSHGGSLDVLRRRPWVPNGSLARARQHSAIGRYRLQHHWHPASRGTAQDRGQHLYQQHRHRSGALRHAPARREQVQLHWQPTRGEHHQVAIPSALGHLQHGSERADHPRQRRRHRRDAGAGLVGVEQQPRQVDPRCWCHALAIAGDRERGQPTGLLSVWYMYNRLVPVYQQHQPRERRRSHYRRPDTAAVSELRVRSSSSFSHKRRRHRRRCYDHELVVRRQRCQD